MTDKYTKKTSQYPGVSWYSRGGVWMSKVVLARPLSDELEESYKNGFNDGQAEGLPEALKAERERIVKWLEDNWQFFEIEDPDDSQHAQIDGYDMLIESLRSE